MKLDNNLDVVCPHCLESSKLEEFDKNTIDKCLNRTMRRDFVSLKESSSFKKGNDVHYSCPLCSEWSFGCQLKITNTDRKDLLLLGGKPLSMK